MAKAKQSLEEGLDRSANKKGYTGAARHRYIGGAIRNMEKRGEFTIKRKPAAAKPAKKTASHSPKPAAHVAPAPKPASKPAKLAYSRPTLTHVAPPKPREKLELVVKVNKEATAAVAAREAKYNRKGYPVYSIYRTNGTRYGTGTYAKKKAAQDEANSAMYAYNHPKGEHVRNRF